MIRDGDGGVAIKWKKKKDNHKNNMHAYML